jgi:hypothetical protein
MAIQNGLPVDAENSNAAFVSKTVNSDIFGIPSLKNNDVGSGAHVVNLQKAINKLFEGVGSTGENDATINEYANNNFILDGDSRKTAIEKLDQAIKDVADGLSNVESEVDQFAISGLVEIELKTGYVSDFEQLFETTDQIGGEILIENLSEV